MSSAVATSGGGRAGAVKPVAGKVKKEGGGGEGKGASLLEAKKKIEASGKTTTVVRPKSATVVVKSEVKTTTTTTASSASKTVTKTKIRAKTEKKVYSLPGQKHDPPEEREPLRIFYESLSKQIPSSEMAQFWMMEHGLLSPDRAKKAYDRKLKRQSQQRLGTPIKPKQDRPESSKKPPPQSKNGGDVKAKRRADSDDDDFTVKPKKAKI
ncbi:uncharacterized protein LOC141840117 [Curcuma longa]|uniref:uncharacterized protein LOC141840117 n=1 Tax=Curcuma longa TaxID=136217 RepID=UPI003D9F033F